MSCLGGGLSFFTQNSIFLDFPQTLPDWKVPILDLGSNTLNMIIIQES
jgi:hypothetical protein